MEYSRDYPNASAPMPAGAGYKKIAAAVRLVKGQMGMMLGKTFNSQQGGALSDQAFYNGTLYDVAHVAAVVPALTGGVELDYKMVETWYPHPAVPIPETSRYTTAYTMLAAFPSGQPA